MNGLNNAAGGRSVMPVLIITYRRFDLVKKILEQLLEAGLRKVYISIDNYPRDLAGFAVVETFLRENDFEYQLKKWETNVGCDRNVMEGIRWFLSSEPSGIILEDDCIPVAGFGAMAAAAQAEMPGQNISFFGVASGVQDGFRYNQLYLPFYWGWYTTRSFFDSFYSFYQRGHSFISLFSEVWRAPLTLRLKLITLMNYHSHRARKKGVAWDSELFIFSLIKGCPFITPSMSVIDNTGFGDLDVEHTHTWKSPDWYSDIRFAGPDTKFRQPVQPFDARLNGAFLESFYRDYTHNTVKLGLTLAKTLLSL